eukprot:TRINITY_DN28299_c0_g1_i1.p1 TRINITY_DN28299_c0_g1~~TRINITY_DN28299_c0_g1_i1.p1  ORF type:complete len:279 (-),score=52.49 TRINITY_DN28299_c0_g1_i1:11-847(-)
MALSSEPPCHMPCVYVNHGGGPMPLMGTPPGLGEFLGGYAKSLPALPTSILIVTAHWEAECPCVSGGERHALMYDYGGFPDECYKYRYDAPGSPALAKRVQTLLEAAGQTCRVDGKRGWDHGVFVPLMLMFPEAKIPVVSLSVLANQAAEDHIRMGEALQVLRDEGVLIVGSGATFHNFDYFVAKGEKKQEGEAHCLAFGAWLRDSLSEDCRLSDDERRRRLVAWEEAPSARASQPTGAAEHLMPLFVVFGAGGCRAGRCLGDAASMWGIRMSDFEFP